MGRTLDDAISNVSYILDSLMALKKIHESGSCIDCAMLSLCKYKPELGEMIRYNCPFWNDERAKE